MKPILFISLFSFSVLILWSCSILPICNPNTFAETQVKIDTIIYYRSTTKNRHCINDTLTYYWTKAGKVHSTKGSHFGRLLHGDYIEMVNDRIIIKGQYTLGLKNGKWKNWEGQNLESVYTWRKGVLHGPFTIFDANENVIERGRFKKGLRKQ